MPPKLTSNLLPSEVHSPGLTCPCSPQLLHATSGLQVPTASLSPPELSWDLPHLDLPQVPCSPAQPECVNGSQSILQGWIAGAGGRVSDFGVALPSQDFLWSSGCIHVTPEQVAPEGKVHHCHQPGEKNWLILTIYLNEFNQVVSKY